MPGSGGPAARGQVVAAAEELFAVQGVAGTSLQNIADCLGVTKAAVYHHFRTKAAIVFAVLHPAMDGLATLLRVVEGHDDTVRRTEAAVVALADQAVVHRRLYGLLLGDVTVGQLISDDAEIAGLFHQLHDVLAGASAGTDASLVRVSVFLSGLMGPAVDPRCAQVEDVALRRELVQIGRALLVPPSAASGTPNAPVR